MTLCGESYEVECKTSDGDTVDVVHFCELQATHFSSCCGKSCETHKCRHGRPLEDFVVPSDWMAL